MNWKVVSVFLLALVLIIATETHPQFPDPDSFYHAKMALILRDQGVIHEFPWLQFTSLKETFINPHLLYHALLIPFVTFLDPLVGMKISAVVFAMVAFFVLSRWFVWMRAPAPWLLLLATVLSAGFLHRLTLPRAPAPAIALLLFLTWTMLAKRFHLLFFGSALFVWFYHGWPLLVPTLGAVMLAEWMTQKTLSERARSSSSVLRAHAKTAGAVIGGLALGLVANPYFPKNITFSVLDIVKIGVVNYQSVIPVGGEWYPTAPSDLFGTNAPILILFGAAFALAVPGLMRQHRNIPHAEMVRTLTLLLLAGGYTVLTLKSGRYVEYAVPFLALATGALAAVAWPFARDELLPLVLPWCKKRRARRIALGAAAMITIAALAINEAIWLAPKNDYFTADQYAPAVAWIRANIPEDAIVFHNSWDYSLVLFYLDDTHHYLVGLDPTFMYDENPALFETWRGLVAGEDPDVSKIENVFGSRVAMVDNRVKEADALALHLEASGIFRLVNENKWIRVYAMDASLEPDDD
jgi:hypothetical protein